MEFRLTAAERIGLVMLAEQHKHLGINEDIDPDLVKEAIYSGNEWAIHWQPAGLLDDLGFDNPPHVSLTVGILDMWSFIEESYERLTEQQRDDLKRKLPEHMSLPPKFVGFDGNNETEYRSVALFLIQKMNRFTQFENHGDLNCHSPSIRRYRSMLGEFEDIRPNLGPRMMTVDEMERLLK